MTDPRRFGLGVSAGELPGDLRRSPARTPTGATRSILPARPQEWSFDARSELRQQLASTSRQFTVDHLWSMYPSTPPDDSATAEAVPIIPSDLPGTSPRAGTVTAYRRPRGPSALGSHSRSRGSARGAHLSRDRGYPRAKPPGSGPPRHLPQPTRAKRHRPRQLAKPNR